MSRFRVISIALGSVLSVGLAASVRAQDPSASPPASPPAAPSSEELAKQLANPVADLISVPFQSNWENGVGPEEDTRYILNFQPVMPFSLSKDMNLIARVIVPVVSQPALVPGGEPTFGMADILTSLFFSPKQSKIIWGVGPAFSLPISSEPTLGTEKWSAGPTFVVLKQTGPWTLGMLANQLWSYAGDSERPDVSQMFLQPFVTYTTRGGVSVNVNTETTINWEAESGERATVPINLLVSKVMKLGQSPVSIGLGGGYFVEKPTGGPSWKVRMLFALLIPTRAPGPPK